MFVFLLVEQIVNVEVKKEEKQSSRKTVICRMEKLELALEHIISGENEWMTNLTDN